MQDVKSFQRKQDESQLYTQSENSRKRRPLEDLQDALDDEQSDEEDMDDQNLDEEVLPLSSTIEFPFRSQSQVDTTVPTVTSSTGTDIISDTSLQSQVTYLRHQIGILQKTTQIASHSTSKTIADIELKVSALQSQISFLTSSTMQCVQQIRLMLSQRNTVNGSSGQTQPLIFGDQPIRTETSSESKELQVSAQEHHKELTSRSNHDGKVLALQGKRLLQLQFNKMNPLPSNSTVPQEKPNQQSTLSSMQTFT